MADYDENKAIKNAASRLSAMFRKKSEQDKEEAEVLKKAKAKKDKRTSRTKQIHGQLRDSGLSEEDIKRLRGKKKK